MVVFEELPHHQVPGNVYFEGVLGIRNDLFNFMCWEDQLSLMRSCLDIYQWAELKHMFRLKWAMVESDPERARAFRLWGPDHGH